MQSVLYSYVVLPSNNSVSKVRHSNSDLGVAVCLKKPMLYLSILGGYDKNIHTDRASVECFDPDTQEWSFVAEMEKARSGLSLVALDHYIYAIGGRSRYSDFYFNTVERSVMWCFMLSRLL